MPDYVFSFRTRFLANRTRNVNQLSIINFRIYSVTSTLQEKNLELFSLNKTITKEFIVEQWNRIQADNAMGIKINVAERIL